MNFHIGLSALQASQFAINTVSQNLANANTPGYHRQRINFQTRLPQHINNRYLGSGVEIGSIDRIRNRVLESAYTNSLADLSNISQSLSVEGQIESLFLPGEGSLQNSLSGFFDELSRLSANPSEHVQRNAVIQQGVSIATQTRNISDRLTDLKSNVRQQIDIEVEELNAEIAALVDLQHQIQTSSSNGPNAVPNDLYDQRDQLINSIATKIDVQRQESVQDGFGLTLAGSISLGHVPIEFEAVTNDDGTVSLQLVGNDRVINSASGSISALNELHNNTIDEYKSKLNEFAQDFIRRVDQAHAQGVGTSGPFSILRSTRTVDSTTLPLNDAGIAFPVDAGELFFSVTDPNGEKRTYSVTIDPTIDSLQDVADRISALGNVQAVVDDQNGSLAIVAQPGFRFDFSGNLETIPDLSSFTGTSTPEISGAYEGDVNRNLTVNIVGDGTIGQTPGLLAQVIDDETGNVIAELNIGEGYEAGSQLKMDDGIRLQFSGGEVVNGDSFSTTLLAEPDSTGILSALGLNSFFTGIDASTIAVANRLIENPNELATSASGDIADTSNLARMLGLRDERLAGENGLTFEDFLGEIGSEIGFRVKTSRALQQNVAELGYQYESEIASISGVDLNEEMLNLAQHQKSYEAAIQVIRTIEAMFDELFAIVR
jgi:flagellar hook-associated protein 1 FlgK